MKLAVKSRVGKWLSPGQLSFDESVTERKCALNVSNLHLCKAAYYHNTFDGCSGNVLVGVRRPLAPGGRSINVLIRTPGERSKVLRDDEGRCRGKSEPIDFPSSRLITEKDQTECDKTM